MLPQLVSILIPVYNEDEFIGVLLERVLAAPLPDGFEREVIVVDDGSDDNSAAIVEEARRAHPGLIRLVQFDRNRGKGAAVRRAVQEARGEYCLIQDADLEYNPHEYSRLLQPLIDGAADVVYGSRFVTSERRRVLYYWHSVANHFLTTLCNIASNLNLTDMGTCYKAFRTALLQSIPIRSNRFGVEPEITIKAAKRQARIYETAISYEGRTYEDGKKTGAWDAVEAVWVILRSWLSNDIYQDPGARILDAFSAAPRFNRWMADTIQPYLGQRVLEIGAGVGNLARLLSKRRARYLATDIDEEHLSRLKHCLRHRTNLETAVCDLSKPDDFRAIAGSMDTVVCLNVLEHIEDDATCLRNIFGALAPGGRAIVLVPEGQSIYGQLDVVLGHVRRYSSVQLRARLEEAGFVLERMLAFNKVSRPFWFLSARVLRRSSMSRTQLKLFDASVWFLRRIDKYLPWRPTSLIAIAAKPGGDARKSDVNAVEASAE